MTVLSLFDGISCGQVALKRAGFNVERYYASEIDKSAIKVTKFNHPETAHIGAVERVNGKLYEGIDLLCGGSPCQSFSHAVSSNTGFDGKSKLFFEYVRIKKECKPKWFLLENVVMKKEWENVITEKMGVEPMLINSEMFTAQSRLRLYWTNIPIAPLPPKSTAVLGDILETRVDGKYFYDEGFEWHGDDKVVCATLAINGHDLIKRVNSTKHKCQCLTAVCGGNQQRKVVQDKGGRVRKLTPREYERLQSLPDDYTALVSDSARYKMLGNCWTVPVIEHIFKGMK